MGHKIPPDYPDVEFGEDCLSCTPSIWLPGCTPKYLYVTFQGVLSCPGIPTFPNNVAIKCIQSEAWACTWIGTIDTGGHTMRVRLDLHSGVLEADWTTLPDNWCFWGLSAQCSFDYVNLLDPCPSQAGEGGRAWVGTSSAPYPAALTSHYAMLPAKKTMYESQAANLDYVLYRLAQLQSHSSCYFVIDPEDFNLSED